MLTPALLDLPPGVLPPCWSLVILTVSSGIAHQAVFCGSLAKEVKGSCGRCGLWFSAIPSIRTPRRACRASSHSS